jgi:hypothetical protein
MANTDSRSAASPIEPGVAQQFTVVPFAPEHLPLVAAFSERYWQRPRSDGFYRWRYLESLPFARTFIAITDHECLGILSALRKNYLMAGEAGEVLEIFDWHGLPGMKGSGVGIRVMRAMMREGLRLFGVGGTADVLKTLPAMGWHTIAQAQTFELALHGDVLQPGLRARAGFDIPGGSMLMDALTATWFRPRRKPFDGTTMEVANIGDEIRMLYTADAGYDFIQVPDPEFLQWLTAGYGGAGSFRICYFVVGGQLRGWALSRVYETDQGREAAIVEIFTPKPTVAVYAWMISEMSVVLAASDPRIIRGRATCPVLQAAFAANRFRKGPTLPVHTWPKMASPFARPHVTLHHSDAPFRPLATPGTTTGLAVP